MCCNIMFSLSSYIDEDDDDDRLTSMRIPLHTVTIGTLLFFLSSFISLSLWPLFTADRFWIDTLFLLDCILLNSVYGVGYDVFLVWNTTGVRRRSMCFERMSVCLSALLRMMHVQSEAGKRGPSTHRRWQDDVMAKWNEMKNKILCNNKLRTISKRRCTRFGLWDRRADKKKVTHKAPMTGNYDDVDTENGLVIIVNSLGKEENHSVTVQCIEAHTWKFIHVSIL